MGGTVRYGDIARGDRDHCGLGVIAYAIHGDVNVGYAALVGLPAAGSVAFATALQQRLRTRTVELLFAGFMLAVAVWLFVK